MPLNPFSPQNQPEENIKRNDFDLSNSSVFTTDFFKLYPAFCKEVIPGDTFEIDFQLGVRGMPTVFPVQTKMRMSMEFYYVRNRTLHDKFEDMIFKTKDVEHPWLRLNQERAKRMIRTGSLGDAFGVPSTVGVLGGMSIPLNFGPVAYYAVGADFQYDSQLVNDYFEVENVLPLENPVYSSAAFGLILSDDLLAPLQDDTLTGMYYYTHVALSTSNFYLAVVRPMKDGSRRMKIFPTTYSIDGNNHITRFDISDDAKEYMNAIVQAGNTYQIGLYSSNFSAQSLSLSGVFVQATGRRPIALNVTVNGETIFDSTEDAAIGSNPFVGSNPQIRLNALPFRAYEMICNYYYRNDKNNPYYLNGEPQYNEFIPTHASGPDDNVYDFHYRNWELDCFTSAQQSPQFGDAPLVGLTWQGSSDVELEFQATNTETSETKNYKVRVGLDDDDNVDSILDFSPDVPSADLQRLQRRIQAGLSINDLRVTNSFQRFLENTMRRGLRYRNQLKSHFGVSVDYPDIDVPQYIGGFSSYLDTGQVTNMADSPNAGLGDYIGTLQGSMSSQNTIRQYCPEHGFIIGVFSMSPIPSYPQSINTYLLHDGPMTYYQSEFRHIGFVPIRHKVLDPLQTPVGGSVNDVFGYQMANYEYKRSLDEVHGDFRTTLRDWVLTRTFKDRPVLTESFTVGKPEQLNDVFVTQNIADAYGSNAKFLCSARFHCVALRQIPVVGTPALE